MPDYLRSGGRKLRVNALLDDASTKAYINSCEAAETGLQGELQNFYVNVLNGLLESFESTPVECIKESLNGKTSSKVTLFNW